MFNFDSETFVILYPYAAGGRFLQMAMSLDPSILAIHTRSHQQSTGQQLFDDYIEALTAGHNNAHYLNSGHLPEYKPENIDYAKRYVFCLHQVELAPALHFLRKNRKSRFFLLRSPLDIFRKAKEPPRAALRDTGSRAIFRFQKERVL